MNPVRRRIKVEELADFSAVAACGTAVVLTPVEKIIDGDTVYTYQNAAENADLLRLRNEITGIQKGEIEDRHNWMVVVD
jgi:branched-chain amino acid aminotransferase